MASYTASSLILGVGRSTAAQIDRFFEARGRSLAPRYAPDGKYQPAPAGIGQMIIDVARTWPQSVNHDLLAAQVVKESAAWQSEYSRHRNNPSGLGAINDDPDQAITFLRPQDGLRATVAHLLTYVAGPGAWTEYDPRANATPSDWQGAVKRLVELEQKWAFTPWHDYNNTPPDQRYGAGIARIANEILKVTVDEMPPDGFTWHQCLIPEGRNNRPGLRLPPVYITIHETANTNAGADAEAHCRYIRSDAAANRPASWHVTVDDHSAYQHLPYNEVAWHAGDGESGGGNRASLAIELCVNSDGNWERTMENAAEIVRGWMSEFNIGIARVVQHNKWSDTSCPARMRAGDWPRFLRMLEGTPPALPGDEAEINGYIVKGPILATYRELESVQEHWSTFGVPVGEEMPGVVVDDIERTVQPFDRAGWVMVEDDRGVIAKPDQQAQINREVYGTDNPSDAVLREALMSIRDIVDTVIVD